MIVPPLSLPFIPAGFGGVLQRMLDFVSLRVRRSDQGMTPSLSRDLRTQTVALHQRLLLLAGAFRRLATLAREGRLRVYPDRRSSAARTVAGGPPPGAAGRAAWLPPPSPFGPPGCVAHGPTLPALPTRGFGWMLGFVPAAHRDALGGVLKNPEMVALIGASASVARLLRPLCHGLGLARPEGVFPALRRRQRRACPRAPARAHTDPCGGTGPDRACVPRAPGLAASPQARDHWWAARHGALSDAGAPVGAGRAAAGGCDGPAAHGRCAKH